MNRLTKLSEEQQDKVIEEYLNTNKSVRAILEPYNVSYMVLFGILKRKGIRTRLLPSKLKESKKLKLFNLINTGIPVNDACKKLKISKASAYKYLRLAGHKDLPRKDTSKYSLNKDFLRKIDSSEKAHFLGMLYSDGTLSSFNKLISLRLVKSDEEYLLKVRKYIDSNKPLYFLNKADFVSPSNGKTYKHNGTAILDITSKIFYQNALNCGLRPRKTYLNLGMPDVSILPVEFRRYFILGMFDGDGCISFCKKNSSCCLSFACSDKMSKDIYTVIKEELNLEGTIRRHDQCSIVYQLNYQRRKDIKKILDWMYEGASLFLARKKNKGQIFIDKYINKLDPCEIMPSPI